MIRMKKICARLSGKMVRVSLAAMTALMVSATAMAQAPAAPATPDAPPAQDAGAKQDSATLGFFQRTEISGFVDAYYSYNFNTPSTPCATVGGVAIFNCLRNFEIGRAHV